MGSAIVLNKCAWLILPNGGQLVTACLVVNFKNSLYFQFKEFQKSQKVLADQSDCKFHETLLSDELEDDDLTARH